ncbi:MAG: radical SAM protein [Candidatus Woesearchaeota archaeon]
MLTDYPDDEIAVEYKEYPELSEIITPYCQTVNLPGYLRISLLEACNQKCFFCHNEGYSGSTKNKIDPISVYKVIDASVRLGKKRFKFTGGEPTLDNNLIHYIKYIKTRYECSTVGIVTNGMRLRELADALYESGLDDIVVSLQSLNEKTYKRVTGVDDVAQVIDGLKAVAKYSFRKITLNVPVSRFNIAEVPKIADFAKANNFKIRLLDILPVNDVTDSDLVSFAELQRKFQSIELKSKQYHPKCKNCSKRGMCGEGDYLRLSARGTLDPCLYREDLKISLDTKDSIGLLKKKLALGFRRIERDDL